MTTAITESVSDKVTRQLNVRIMTGKIRFTTAGHVDAWPAPSVRGAVLKPLRDRLCLLNEPSKKIRDTIAGSGVEQYCRDCGLNSKCLYGRVFEPDRMMIAGLVERGQRDGLRAMTIGTGLRADANNKVKAGDTVSLRILSLGPQAEQILLDVIEELGRCKTARGLGPDRVRFHCDFDPLGVAAGPEHGFTFDSSKLTSTLEGSQSSSVTIRLDSPLFIKRPQQRGVSNELRQRTARSYASSECAAPTFDDLLRESVRVVRRTIYEYGDPQSSQRIDYPELVNRGSQGVTADPHWQPFARQRSSARQDRRWRMGGWLGHATYHNVPQALVSWLTWAGRIGVGDSRNCGAGCWTVSVT